MITNAVAATAANAATEPRVRVMGASGRPLTGKSSGRRPGGMHIEPDELYRYHLGLVDKTALADKYETNTASVYRKVVVFLRQAITECGLTDASIVQSESTSGKYAARIQLDTDRLQREGLLTWQAFAAAYLARPFVVPTPSPAKRRRSRAPASTATAPSTATATATATATPTATATANATATVPTRPPTCTCICTCGAARRSGGL